MNIVIEVGNIVSTGNWDSPQRGRIYSPLGCCPALNTCQGGGLEPKIIEVYEEDDCIRRVEDEGCEGRDSEKGLAGLGELRSHDGGFRVGNDGDSGVGGV